MHVYVYVSRSRQRKKIMFIGANFHCFRLSRNKYSKLIPSKVVYTSWKVRGVVPAIDPTILMGASSPGPGCVIKSTWGGWGGSLHECMFVRMYMYVWLCDQVCLGWLPAEVYVCVCMHVCMHRWLYAFMYMCMHVSTIKINKTYEKKIGGIVVRVCVHRYVCMYHIYACVYVCMYENMLTHTQLRTWVLTGH